jgi:hypothetical protein
VWDVDDVFPSLDRTLAAMNTAQEVFGFEMVNLSVPLDVWHVDAAEGTNFLDAERVARRLKSKSAELGADVLACVTRHWLRDDDWLYLYGWWPDEGDPPILIFSVAGFEELPAEGDDTNRAIANAMVMGLSGFYGHIGTHSGGAKNCPMAFNRERGYAHLVGPQQFDAACRRRLSRKLGKKMGALDALLKVFES